MPKFFVLPLLSLIALLVLQPPGATAQPTHLNYQGLVRVDYALFDGDGQFKFALGAPDNTARQAKATPTVSNGFLTGFTIDDGGSGYETPPVVTINDTTGSNAVYTVEIEDGAVSAITVTAPGSHYSATPTVVIEPPPSSILLFTTWSHDNTSVIGSEPTSALTIPVSNGVFSVVLGDTSIAGMSELPRSTFRQTGLKLRVWFNDGIQGFEQLKPDHPLTPAPYAAELIKPQITPALNMVQIQPGSFSMGSPLDEADRKPEEGPQTTVSITQPFWMGIYPVTQAEYLEVMETNPSLHAGNADHPVENLTWNEANTYCTTLTAQEQSAGNIPLDYTYRLPTEAEREYAARAGTITRLSYGTDDGFTNLTSYAWYFVNTTGSTKAVGEKKPNNWGLYDMHGNVWEWCSDWFADSYPGGALIDPTGPTSGTSRVLRGGSWGSEGRDCRSAARIGRDPLSNASVFGFRVVLSKTR